jgi:hypothetical protein
VGGVSICGAECLPISAGNQEFRGSIRWQNNVSDFSMEGGGHPFIGVMWFEFEYIKIGGRPDSRFELNLHFPAWLTCFN